jgi:hypothetical protein
VVVKALSPLDEFDSKSIDFLELRPTYLKAEFWRWNLFSPVVGPVAVAAFEAKLSLLMSSMSPVMLFLTIDVIRSSLLGSTSFSMFSYSCCDPF